MVQRRIGRGIAAVAALTVGLALLGLPAQAAPSDTHSIGNLVYYDYDGGYGENDGYANPGDDVKLRGDEGVFDADVELLSASGTVIAQQKTDAGTYRFDGLAAGTYRVRLPARNFAAGGPLYGHQSSTRVGSTDMTTSGNRFDHGLDDGTDPVKVGITSAPVTLGPADPLDDLSSWGGNAAHGPNGDDHDNLVVDFGVVPRLDWDLDLADTAPGPHPVGSTVTIKTTLRELGPGDDRENDLSVFFQPYPQGWTFLAENDGESCFGYELYGEPGPPQGFSFGVGDCAFGDPLPRWQAGDTFTFTLQFRVDAVPAEGASIKAHLGASEFERDTTNNTDVLAVATPGAPALLAVGDRVWVDDDADGVQDPAEGPAPGVRVELLDSQSRTAVDAGGKPVAPKVTGTDGAFVFDGLSAGQYRLRIRRDASSTSAPRGYRFTTGHVGDATTDSDTGTTGISPVFALSPTGTHVQPTTAADGLRAKFIDRTVDAGLQPLFAIGNRVWLDADGDGRQDSGEASLAGAQISLTTAAGQPARHGNGTLVKPVRTAANGYYILTGLPRGSYVVTISDIRLCPPQTSTCSVVPPSGGVYRFSPTRAAGATAATNSDVDATGRSKPVLLAVGAPDVVKADTKELDAAWKNSTVDAGVVLR